MDVNSCYLKERRFKNETTYYRIVFRGIVALVFDPTNSLSFADQDSGSDCFNQLPLKRTGAYLSYGEIIATAHDILEIDVPLSQQSPSSIIYRFIRVDDVLTGGYAVDGTSDKVGLVDTPNESINSTVPTKDLYLHTHDNHDDVLSNSSHSSSLPDHLYKESLDAANVTILSNSSSQSPSPFGYLLISSTITSADSNDTCIQSIKISTCPHYPLLNHKQETLIVQQIPHPPLLCQAGTFVYKVTSPTPLPILVGPCDDAPTLTHGKILPDTVQEISLRIGSVFTGGDVSKDSVQPCPDLPSASFNTSLEDGVVYLRLSHKKGWIADRRRIYSPVLGSKSDGRKSTDSPPNTSPPLQYQYQMVVRDITHVIESIGGDSSCFESLFYSTSSNDSSFTKGDKNQSMDNLCNNNWDQEKHIGSSSMSSVMSSLSSVSSSAMSTLSISTPLNILKMRQRKRVGAEKNKVGASDSVQNLNATTKNSSHQSTRSDGISISKNIQSPTRNGPLGASEIKFVEPQGYPIKPQDNGNTQSNKRPQQSDELPPQSKPNLYLMRVNAPLGLKILDASHFQVNHLIRRPSTSAASTHSASSTSTTSLQRANSIESNLSDASKKNQPSSIFHTMTGGLICPKSTPAVAWEIDSVTGKRYLPRGLVFEASKRMERATNFVDAMGLIKLADDTGWAIVPTPEELLSQYSSLSGENKGRALSHYNFEESLSSVDAFEEIGNAFIRTHRENENISSSAKASGCWLRVILREGVTVSCAPLHSRQHGSISNDTNLNMTHGPSKLNSSVDPRHDPLVKRRDSDSGSMINVSKTSSKKKDDTRSNKKIIEETRPIVKETAIESDRTALTAAFRKSAQHHIQRHLINFRISCGMCVEVEPSQNSNSKSQVGTEL